MLLRAVVLAGIFGVILAGCSSAVKYSKSDIVKITDFELSPDESKIAFSAITPVGNLDIWVVDIDGKSLKKLTFQDHSPTNHIAKFFKKHHWANYFEIDMCSPKWTSAVRIEFCQKLTKYEMWGSRIISKRFKTIKPDGTDERSQIDSDEIIKKEQISGINKFKFSDRSEKYKITILLKNDYLWTLKDGEISPKRLIQ